MNIKNEKGITLTILVITIIVMLIIAGATANMLFDGAGLFKKSVDSKEKQENHANLQEIKTNELINELDTIRKEQLEKKTPIDKTTSYVGYYADIEGDGTVDGVIFADLAKGKTGVGSWPTSTSDTYTIPKKEGTELSNLKDYYISQKNYSASDAKFGTKDVISPINGSSGEDRFYVMALTDINPGTYYCWYAAAYGNMSDYSSITSTGFGAGKTNTTKMIEKWNLASDATGYYGAHDTGSYKDMWGVIKDKVSGDSKWFVPSKDEWSAFAGELKISKTSSDATYYGNLGLSYFYWSSSQYYTNGAWYAGFFTGFMDVSNVNGDCYVRLSATF